MEDHLMKKIIGSILSLLILINVFVPVNAEQSTVSTSDNTKWQVNRNVSDLNRISCFKNKLYIAIGDYGTIRTSPDSLNWTLIDTVPASSTYKLNDIVCTNDQIIVVGDNGTILRSTDGSDWTIIKSVTSSTINKVIYGKNLFVAFTDSPGEILTSKNGTDWKASKIHSKNKIFDAVYNGKVFVTVGESGEICTSANGLDWKVQVIKKTPSFEKLLWNGKMFVTFGTTTAATLGYTSGLYTATSRDGYTWSVKSINMGFVDKKYYDGYSGYSPNIIWNGKTFVITLLGSYYGKSPCSVSVFISKIGLEWKRSSFDYNTKGYDYDGIYCSSKLVWDGNKFLFIGNTYYSQMTFTGPQIYTSKDGIVWKCIIDATCWNSLAADSGCSKVNDLIYNNGKIITVGYCGEIRSSKDGLNWDNMYNFHMPLNWNGKKFISVDNINLSSIQTNKNPKYVYTSVGGLVWKEENQIDCNITFGNIYWTGKEYITFGPNYLSTSRDLITWDKNTNSVCNDIGIINAFATDGTNYVVAGQNGTAVSKDMKNWVCKKARNYYKSIIIGGSSFVALNSGNDIDVSYDGLKWKRIKIKDYNNTIIKIIYAIDKFVGIGTTGDVWYSTDGAKWMKTNSTANFTLNDICWTGNEFIAVGIADIIITSKDGIVWQQEESPIRADFDKVYANSENVIIKFSYGNIYKSLK